MKKLIFVLSFSLIGCNKDFEKVVEAYPDGKPMIIFISDSKDDSLNYTKKVLYNSGTLDYLGQFVNGKKSGVWTWWYENGNRKDQCRYVEGIYVDTVFHWYKSGHMKQVQILPETGMPEGVCCVGETYQYFESGEWIMVTYKDNLLNGPTSEYNVDSLGNFYFVKGQYKDDKENGYWEWFDADSVLYQTAHYEDGDFNGLHRTYYPNRKIKSQGSLKDGKYEGLVIYYDEHGKIVEKENYKAGELIK